MPGVKTVIDGRCLDAQLMFNDRMMKMTAFELSTYLKQNNVNAAVVMKRERRFIDFFGVFPDFQLVSADDQAVLFIEPDHRNDVQPHGSLGNPATARGVPVRHRPALSAL